MQLAPSIFKAYDIRGIVPSTVDEAVAEALGRAFGTIALREGETTVAVGRDGRLSGPSLCGALARGLVAAGMRIGGDPEPVVFLRDGGVPTFRPLPAAPNNTGVYFLHFTP